MPDTGRLRREMHYVAEGARLRYRLATLICWLMPQFSLSTVRAAVYRWLGVRAGPRVSFLHTIQIIGSGPNPYARLTIGEDSTISTVLFNLEGTVTIGRNVFVGPGVRIYTSKHDIGGPERRFSPGFTSEPVVIEDGAWIGVGAIILSGVTVGRGSVVSAGSVVMRDVPPNTVVSGVPATVVKELSAG